MKYEFIPYVEVGPIRFLMARNDVRDAVGKTPVEFSKTRKSKSTTDDFGDFHIFYDTENRAEAVEFFPGSVEVVYEGKNLFECSLAELERLLSVRDADLNAEADSLTSSALGIAVYAPSKNAKAQVKPECITVYRKGYYD